MLLKKNYLLIIIGVLTVLNLLYFLIEGAAFRRAFILNTIVCALIAISLFLNKRTTNQLSKKQLIFFYSILAVISASVFLYFILK